MSVECFRGSVGPSLGVELEFQLVDATSLALTGAAEGVLAEVPGWAADSVKPEFYHCCVEVNTGVCRDVAEVENDLAAKVTATARAAAQEGALLAWGGTHPFSHWRDQPVVSTARYPELAEHYRETLCRQLTFGLHMHVGVGDGDTAVRVCNGMVEHLPALLALSANSPFWCGRATGLHSHRVEVMGSSPTGTLPPRLGGWGDYAQLVDRMTAAGLIQSLKDLWWDVRPSPCNGTIEVRICDMPPDLPGVVGLTALTQCLVADLAWRRADAPALDDYGLMVLRQNRWRAARFGLEASFVDPRTGCRSIAREVIKRQVDRLRGVAEALGCRRQLAAVKAMADGPTGAERQLSVFERTGDLSAVVRQMAAEDARRPMSPAPTSPARGVASRGTELMAWPTPRALTHFGAQPPVDGGVHVAYPHNLSDSTQPRL